MKWLISIVFALIVGLYASAEDCSDVLETERILAHEVAPEYEEKNWIQRLMSLTGRSTRVVGGRMACPGDWPYFAAMRRNAPRGIEYFCGGTAIGREWVLTAAHCVNNMVRGANGRWIDRAGDSVELVVGSVDLETVTNANVFPIRDIVVYPEYQPINQVTGEWEVNDIALIRLDRPWMGATATLSSLNEELDADASYGRGFVAGFGLTSVYQTDEQLRQAVAESFTQEVGNKRVFAGTRHLMSAMVPLVPGAECLTRYKRHDQSSKICAGYLYGGRDTCAGDSGGPIIALNQLRIPYLVGVTSYGQGCAAAGSYGVYSRVSAFRNWIEKYVPDVEFTFVLPETDRALLLSAQHTLVSDLSMPEDDFSISLNAGGRFMDGDQISLTVETINAGQLIILDLNPAGIVTQLFPNRYMESMQSSLISYSDPVTIPSRKSGNFLLRARANPPGEGRVIALLMPSDERLPDEFAPIAENGLVPREDSKRYVLNLADIIQSRAFNELETGERVRHEGWAAVSVPYIVVP